MKRSKQCCSFCRKSYTEVGPLVEGPGDVYICRQCVELCQSIIGQERRRRNPSCVPVEPALVRARLDQLVSGQEVAKQALMQAAASWIEGEGRRVLLIGPASSAKMLLARVLAHVIEAPFAAGDANGLQRSEPNPAEQLPLLLRLLEASDFDVEAAERGIVFLDGVDQPEVQQALLRLWQDRVCHPVEGCSLKVSAILFICSGSFAGLEEVIVRSGRHEEQPVQVEDLIATGVRSDWAGRLAGIARVTPLDEETLVRVVRWVNFRSGN